MRSRVLHGLLAGAVLVSVAPVDAWAQTNAVPALLRQAKYWEGRGRRDLAVQAYRRVLAIDPSNATARRGVAGPAATPAPAPAKPAPQPKPQAAPRPAPRPAAAPTPTPAPAPAAPRRTTPAPSRDPGGDARAAGFTALDNGNLERAETLFRSALKRSSNDADALGGLGLVELRRERFAEARDLLQRASRGGRASRWAEALQSASFFADLRTAQADFDAGRVAEAQATAERLSRSGAPSAQTATELLARIYQQQGRYADAANLYTQAARASGGAEVGALRVSAIRAQAQAEVAAGRPGQAQQLYDRAISLDPNDPWLRYDYARFLRDQRRPMDATTVISPLAQSAAPESLYAAALFAQQSGQTGAAETLMARVPEGSRTEEMNGFLLGLRAEAAVTRARALGAQGQQQAALQSLRQIADTPGLPAEQTATIATALFELGDTQGASMLAQRAASMPVTSAEAYDPIVRVLAATGQDMAAEEAISRATQLAGGTAQGMQTVATLRSTMAVSRADRLRLAGQYAPAFDVLQQAWAATPGDSDVLASLGRLYQTGGLNAQAAQTYRMILAKDPNNRDALIGFAETASSAGEHGAAREAARQAIRVAPSDYRSYLAAARIEQARGDDGAARKYLSQARSLYVSQAGGGGGNPFGGNPFAQMAQPAVATNPFAPVTSGSNPFAFGSGNAGVQTASMSPMGLAPVGTPIGSPLSPSPRADGYAAPYPVGGAAASPQNWMPGTPGAPGPAPQMVAQAGDPVLQGIEADMRRLAASSAPRADITTGYRDRSGETGLSTLKELSGTAKISTGMAGGRVGVQAQAVVLDSGRPTGSGLARFGRNGTAEAQAIVAEQPSNLTQASTQHDAGVAIAATYEGDLVQADFGTTPLGFAKRNAAGGIAVTPRFSPEASARIFGERRPVTDSVLSYAGTIDPVTGQFWGAVMRSGGGASLSWDRDGTGGYIDGAWHHYDGVGVRDNSSVQFNAGGYTRAYRDSRSTLTLGINANYQTYGNNQNYFTYGHGGYFSPQSFFSVSFPVRFAMNTDRFEIAANVAPGYQSYEQDEAPLYPTDPVAQTALDALKAQNSDVRARYDSLSETGFGLAAGASAYYGLAGSTRVGGDINVNTFGQYNDVRTSVGIKQTLGGEK
jgi:tetratricopeptide (TPR) repeat protein